MSHTHTKLISEVTGVNDYGPFTSIHSLDDVCFVTRPSYVADCVGRVADPREMDAATVPRPTLL